MGMMGFNASIPQGWNKWWLAMWFAFSVTLVVLAVNVSARAWAIASVPLFFVPEGISLLKRNDSLPPLTHTIRHFIPDYVAFPLIYGLLGCIGANWLGFPRPLHIGGLFALLGWLTNHFAGSYAEPDPYPFSRRAATPKGAGSRRLPL